MINEESGIIENQIEIQAPIGMVWDALTNASKFGQWFKVSLESDFIAGQTTKGTNLSKGFEMKIEFFIKEIKPKTYFSYKWHPYPMDQTFDYSKEEPTLVEFFLEPNQAGTLLKVRESGFNKVNASRRATAFKMHTGGWEAQLNNVKGFVLEAK
jgi:uncharacterized protein YndB with AHSA1/START domain